MNYKISHQEIIQKAVKKYAKREQLEMLQEESTELALATRRLIRKGDSDDLIENLASEMADVTIMIQQMLLIYDGLEQKVNTKIANKLDRLHLRMSNVENADEIKKQKNQLENG